MLLRAALLLLLPAAVIRAGGSPPPLSRESAGQGRRLRRCGLVRRGCVVGARAAMMCRWSERPCRTSRVSPRWPRTIWRQSFANS